MILLLYYIFVVVHKAFIIIHYKKHRIEQMQEVLIGKIVQMRTQQKTPFMLWSQENTRNGTEEL